MCFEQLVLNQQEPVSVQVVRFFKKQILIGLAEDGEEVPSRRVLAALLSINPNTAQKIYKQLEEEKLIHTLPNSKTYLCVSETKREEIQKDLLEGQTKAMLHELKSCQQDFKQVIDLITRLWDDV